MTNKSEELKERIIKEMTVSYANALEKNIDLAKNFFLITSEGNIDVIIREKIDNKEQVLLYLIGKHYAKITEFSKTEYVGNKELMIELGIPEGSVKPTLKSLREEGKIKRTKEGKKVLHSIKLNLIEGILKSINEKIDGKWEIWLLKKFKN